MVGVQGLATVDFFSKQLWFIHLFVFPFENKEHPGVV